MFLNPALEKGDNKENVAPNHFVKCISLLLLQPWYFSLSHQKLDGCNKMTCTGCMQYFCWICMGSLSRANPYKHFTDPASPCFNRYVFPELLLSAVFWYLICRPQAQEVLALFREFSYIFKYFLLYSFHSFLSYILSYMHFLENEFYDENVLSEDFL